MKFKVGDLVLDTKTSTIGNIVSVDSTAPYPITVSASTNNTSISTTFNTFTIEGKYCSTDAEIRLVHLTRSTEFFTGGVIINRHYIVRYKDIVEVADSKLITAKGVEIHASKEIINDLFSYILNKESI